tara:strand:+ start:1248 stop:1757 length:510 start_codon:yes stop_codon:yes gene_type:complete
MAFNFKELSLSEVDVSTAAPILMPGRYVVEVKDAELRGTKNGGDAVQISMTDTKGGGSLRGWLNVNVPSSKPATRIGREQLKALLTFGGHPTPDNPNDIKSLIGLTVGISVGKDTYQKDGVEREGSKLKGFFDPSELDPDILPKNQSHTSLSVETSAKNAQTLDDEIPF